MQNKANMVPEKLSNLDEFILVVKGDKLIKNVWQGLNTCDIDDLSNTIKREKEFQPRSVMESDYNFKQVIPYVIFRYQNSYFLMQRKASASEQRLKNKFSLGIGGHINEPDINNTNIETWAYREFHEEVEYFGKLNMTLLGFLNDDSNDVGKVHLGMVFVLDGDNASIRVKSELKNGMLVQLNELKNYFDDMESWSQIVYDYLWEKSYGIVLLKDYKSNKLCVFDRYIGKILVTANKLDEKVLGSIIAYEILQKATSYKISNEHIIQTLKTSNYTNIVFLHHYLELINFLIPFNEPYEKVFEFLLCILNLDKQISKTTQKILVCKLLDILGIFAQKAPSHATINLIRSVPIDFIENEQIDLSTKKDMLDWILESLSANIKKHQSRTFRFIKYFG